LSVLRQRQQLLRRMNRHRPRNTRLPSGR
jgi:hypothetical protein